MREPDLGKGMAEVARLYQLSPKRLETWKGEWWAKGEVAFPGKGACPQARLDGERIAELERKIGQLGAAFPLGPYPFHVAARAKVYAHQFAETNKQSHADVHAILKSCFLPRAIVLCVHRRRSIYNPRFHDVGEYRADGLPGEKLHRQLHS